MVAALVLGTSGVIRGSSSLPSRTMENLMGVDYGSKRTGLALAKHANLATPFLVLDNLGLSNLAEKIASIAKAEQVSKVVIGDSKNFQMQDNEIMIEAKQLAQKLQHDYGLEVFWELEILTSHQAQHLQGKNKMLDASAATIILQSYLDKQKNK